MDYNTNFPRLQEANEKMFKKFFAQPKRGGIPRRVLVDVNFSAPPYASAAPPSPDQPRR